MKKVDCPYCALAKKQGELFCSRHADNMEALDSGVFFLYEKTLEECDWHVTRLSLNFNLDGPQHYFAGNREYRVTPEKYLLINQGQVFKTVLNSDVANRMVTIAFRVGLAEELHFALTHDHNYLLDHPVSATETGLDLFEKTYRMDDFLHTRVQSLIQTRRTVDQQSLNDVLESMLTYILLQQADIHRTIACSIRNVRASTRIEIYKRLQWALEYVNDHYRDEINITTLAREACLSPFHFKRLFKAFFNAPPYQYIRKLRIAKAEALLLDGMSVQDACRGAGWKDPSSFIRLFKKMHSTTPAQYSRALKP